MPRITIVIPAFNVGEFIADAVKSALSQTVQDVEVIVVDDGSTDATASILADIDDDRLLVIRKDNSGLAAARNTGLRAATAAYVGFLDGDDLWHATKAEKQLRMMDNDPSTIMTYSDSAYIDEGGCFTGEFLMSRVARPTLQQMIRRNHVGNGSTPIVRTRAARDTGLFDERLRTNGEDYEFWCRLLHRYGHGSLVHVAEPLTLYRIRTNSLSVSFDNFLASVELANQFMRSAMPEVPHWVMREGLAGCYRIASRKSASLKRPGDALRYMAHAVMLAPWLPFTDPRLAATVALILTNGRAQKAMHMLLKAAMVRRW